MRAISAAVMFCLVSGAPAFAQMGRTTDWWTLAADAQRSGWEKNELRFTKDDVPKFQFLWEMKLPQRATGVRALSAAVVFGNLIGSRGFKELVFIQGAAGDLWSIDTDLARMYWENHPKDAAGACSAFATTPALPAPVVFRFRASTPPAVAAQPKIETAPSGSTPARPPTTPNREAPSPPPSALNAAFRVRPVYMIAPNGDLHQVNIDDGSELHEVRPFVPPPSKGGSVNIADNTIYTTAGACKGNKNTAVYALDLGTPAAKPTAFEARAAGTDALANPAIGSAGTVYVQTGKGKLNPAAGDYGNALVALTAKELKVKDYFSLAGDAAPVAFTFKGRELVADAGSDGRIYLLDGNALGGSDHKTPLFRSEALPRLWGGLSTWEQTDGTRYLLATVWGKHGANANGSVVAFQLHDENGNVSLTPAWTSPDLLSPDPPVIAQGVVFVLANGKYKGKLRPDPSSHATLYALDGLTGQALWSTGDQVKQPGNLSGLTVANSRLYFTTVDNTLHVFGKYLEIEQH